MLRIVDFTLALVGLVFALPLLLVVMLVIRLDSPGRALFAQTRVGRDLQPFTCYKLRTMRAGTRQAASHEVGSAAITGIGKVLRRTKLDELPQLWNVVCGEMSLVGPRPCLPTMDEMIRQRTARGVHRLRPGLTGWAQVNGRNALSWEEKFALDVYYVDNQSMWLDLKILFVTLAHLIRPSGISSEGSATMPEFMGSAARSPPADEEP